MYADDGHGNRKVGHAKVKPNYDYPNVVEIKDITIEEPYSHPLTYTYFTKAIIDKSNKRGAVFNIECVNDKCYEQLVEIGSITDNCNNLIIRK